MTAATNEGKVIIFSAPSGSGKSTIINNLRSRNGFPFSFSVSATNRPPRQGEQHGIDYFFLSTEEFIKRKDEGDFLETCEVYPGRYYGTLKSEVLRQCDEGQNIVLDVDVEGGIAIKKIFQDKALSIFIMPPSIEVLRSRLENRGTDTPEKIEERLQRAEYEISLSKDYDIIVTNDDLETAVDKAEERIRDFLGRH